MANKLGIAPPPPPKKSKKAKSEEKAIAKDDFDNVPELPELPELNSKHEEAPKSEPAQAGDAEVKFEEPVLEKFSSDKPKKGFFSNLFGSKDKKSDDKKGKMVEDLDLEKIRAEFGIFADKLPATESGLNEPDKMAEHSEELDLEKVRSDFGIPNKDEKSKKDSKPAKDLWSGDIEDAKTAPSEPTEFIKEEKKDELKKEPSKWDDGDLVKEYHSPEELSTLGWDVEESHTKAESLQKELEIKEETPKLEEMAGIISIPEEKPTKKGKQKKADVKPEAKEQKPVQKKNPVDKEVAKYFNRVEYEQGMIQKELEEIAIHPKTALKKSTEEYIIHHNEKLIKSLKELAAAVKSIDDRKFIRSVQENKKAFTKWINEILEEEKKAEKQRNDILKQKMKELLKEYGQGIKKDVEDMKYTLDKRKKDAVRHINTAKETEKRLKKWQKELEGREKNVKGLIEQGINKIVDKKLRSERLKVTRTENALKKLVDEYTDKYNAYKIDYEKFKKARAEAKELLENAPAMKRKEKYLENKQNKLAKVAEEQKAKEKEFEAKEKELAEREKKAQEILRREQNLILREKELNIKWRDFEIQRKQFEIRSKEVAQMESHITNQVEELQDLKIKVTDAEQKAAAELMTAKEIEQAVLKTEEQRLGERKSYSDDLDDIGEMQGSRILEPKQIDSQTGEFMFMISRCKGMVENNQLRDAKVLYNEIKGRFSTSSIEPREKEIVYNSIRELYDDIYLAIIATQN